MPSCLSSRPSTATPAELLRVARVLADSEGWEASATAGGAPEDRPGEGRIVVSGGALPGRGVLRVREADPVVWPPRDVLARRAAGSEHVIAVLSEVGTRRIRGREVDAVVLAHADGGDLAQLLQRRRGLRGGEAATILLGVAAGLAALHTGGWASPELSPSGIVFGGDGCPALDLLDGVVRSEPAAVVADADAFYALARMLSLRVVDGTGMVLLSAVEKGLRVGRWEAVEASVLSAIAPEPVGLAGDRAGLGGVTAPRTREAPGRRRRSRSAKPVGRPASAIGVVMDFLDDQPIRESARRVGAWVRRRPMVVVAGAVPIALALAAAVLLPGSPSAGAPAAGVTPANSPGVSAHPSEGGAPTVRPTVRPTRESGPASSAQPTGTAAGAAGTAPAPAVGGDDPVDAARDALRSRHDCFVARPATSSCLADILDGASAFAEQEAAALGSPGADGARDYTGARFSLLERWGAAALVNVVPDAARTPESEPASLLLVKSEAGWRLRAVFP
ncbi:MULTISPECIES: hypothetical protein [unclassified Leifsonia]|uniref:hypothetical protein n=1 Tax=unclassified Leifsonia TaxID=2663824 RepID=UPI0008A78439|nr:MULTISPECIES: hypothetical protein [unclassified Leifsonia]SEH97111.1 hypothetical protein SAMN04515694_10855 [Leifsonia sp. CL154]SFL63542.1 hypothetical protein SAMN04515692_10881 [Leifsonia sp. CL147]